MPSEGRAELAHPEAAGWLLGTLDPAETDVFRRHLPGCAHCQAAMTELAPVRRALRGLSPPVDPPPGLEARAVAAVLDAASGGWAGRRRPGRRALGSVSGSFTPVHCRSPATATRLSMLITDAGGRWRAVFESV
jgi:anti-sigma factor RsiW